MANSNIKVSNVFKHTEREEIKKGLTDKWIYIIKMLEQIPQRNIDKLTIQ